VSPRAGSRVEEGDAVGGGGEGLELGVGAGVVPQLTNKMIEMMISKVFLTITHLSSDRPEGIS
jgi:hypothetical protein